MSIQFRCPGCDSLMQVEDDLAGRRVRCPRCQVISPAPGTAPHAEPDDPESDTAIAKERTSPAPRAAEEALPALAAPPRRYADEERESRPVPRRLTRSSPSLALVLAGLAVLLLAAIGAGGWLLAHRSPTPAAEARNDPEPPAPEQRPKEQPAANVGPPGAPEPPVKVTLANGTFETQVPLPLDAGGANNAPVTRRYQFDAKADLVYWVRVGGDFQGSVRVDGPGGIVLESREPFGALRHEGAFQATQAGAHTVTVSGEALPGQPCKLRIREMDGTEPLPDRLKLPAVGVDLPWIEPTQAAAGRPKPFSGAAFAPDGKSCWMAHGDGTLSVWDLPELRHRGNYQIAERLFALGADRHGRLYGQAVKADGPLSATPRSVGALGVWEDLPPPGDKVPLPPPKKTIPLRGIVQRLISSPDGRWLYFLDVHNRKLGRIDTDRLAVDREIDDLSPGARAFCLTPDGNTIYCCADTNALDVIDAREFKLTGRVRLDRGQPSDVAASNEGLVFLVGQRTQFDLLTASNCMLVDLTHGVAAETKVAPINLDVTCRCVRMLPDQRAVLFSSDRRVIACSLPSRPALFKMLVRMYPTRDAAVPGLLVVSPGGRTLLHDSGVILSVSR
jgi:hypothetical protein